MKVYLLFHNITSRVTSDPSVKFCELLRAWGGGGGEGVSICTNKETMDQEED